MNRIASTVIAAIVAATPPVMAADKPGHGHGPKHGGVFVEVRDIDYELVAKPDLIQLYVSDHGKTVNLNGASAKLTFLIGNEKEEVVLSPAGDKLEAKGTFKVGAGTRVGATVSLAGKKPVAMRFVLK